MQTAGCREGCLPTIGQVLERNERPAPQREALVYAERRYSYADLDAAVNRAGRALSQHGVAQGDRVALMSPNSDRFIVAYYALLKLGAIVVPINVRLAVPELAFQLKDSGASLLLYDPEFSPVTRAAMA